LFLFLFAFVVGSHAPFVGFVFGEAVFLVAFYAVIYPFRDGGILRVIPLSYGLLYHGDIIVSSRGLFFRSVGLFSKL
jgi:hypothetical protein